MELLHHGAHTAAPGPHAGAHGIDALHGGPNGHLGPGTGLPGDVADFHLTLGNFRGFQLEQAANQVGMGAGHVNQGSTVGLADLHHIDPYQIALFKALSGNLLGGGEQCLGGLASLADFQNHVPGGGGDPQHGAGEQLLGFAGVALEHHAPLGLPDALNHHLLGGLGGDAAEFGNIHGDVDGIPHLGVGIDIPGGVDVDFQSDVLQLLHGGFHLEHAQTVLVQVHHHIVGGNVPMVLPVLAVGVGEGLLQPLHHIVHGNALELFQVPETCENFRADVHLGCFGLFFGFGISCHALSSCQNSTRSRTSATWDFSN